MINIDQLKEIQIKIGTIEECEKVEGSEKLLKMKVNFGDETRQILAGIAQWYTPDQLIGVQCPFVVNLEPRTMMGLESQGMILATQDDDGVVILKPERPVTLGSVVL